MKWASRVAATVFGFGLMAAASHGAMAQTYGLNNSSLQSGVTLTTGWQVEIAGCTITLNGGAQNPCSGTQQVVITSTPTSLSLAFSGSPSPLLSTTSGGGNSDLNIGTLDVKAPGSAIIWEVGDTLTGTAGGGSNSLVSTNLSGFSALTISLGSTLPASSGANANVISSGVDAQDTAPPSGSNSLISMTYTFNAPEPVSLSLLAVGIFGLGAVRYRRGAPGRAHA